MPGRSFAPPETILLTGSPFCCRHLMCFVRGSSITPRPSRLPVVETAEPATGLLVDPQADSPIAASAQAAASFAEDMREEGRGSPQDRCLQSCTVFTFAAVTGPAPKLGVIAVALLVAVAILARTARPRAWAMP